MESCAIATEMLVFGLVNHSIPRLQSYPTLVWIRRWDQVDTFWKIQVFGPEIARNSPERSLIALKPPGIDSESKFRSRNLVRRSKYRSGAQKPSKLMKIDPKSMVEPYRVSFVKLAGFRLAPESRFFEHEFENRKSL